MVERRARMRLRNDRKVIVCVCVCGSVENTALHTKQKGGGASKGRGGIFIH